MCLVGYGSPGPIGLSMQNKPIYRETHLFTIVWYFSIVNDTIGNNSGPSLGIDKLVWGCLCYILCI